MAVRLDMFQNIVNVGWGGPWMMVFVAWYPEESLAGDDPALFGLDQAGDLHNAIEVFGGQYPLGEEDGKVQYKGQFQASSHLDNPRSDPSDDAVYPFETGGGTLTRATNNNGPPVYEDAGARWFNPNPLGMEDSPYAQTIADTLESMRIPGLGADGLPPEDDPDGSYYRIADLGGGLLYEYGYAAEGEGGTVLIFPNYSSSGIIPAPAVGVVGGYQIYGYRLFNPNPEGDAAPVSLVAMLVNLSPVLLEKKLLDPLATGYRLTMRYGGVEEDSNFGDGKRGAKAMVHVFPRGDFVAMMEHYQNVLQQIDDFNDSDADPPPPTYDDLDDFLAQFDPPVPPLINLTEDIPDPTSIYGDHLMIDVQMSPALSVSFGT